jgi:hypothetical protein
MQRAQVRAVEATDAVATRRPEPQSERIQEAAMRMIYGGVFFATMLVGCPEPFDESFVAGDYEAFILTTGCRVDYPPGLLPMQRMETAEAAVMVGVAWEDPGWGRCGGEPSIDLTPAGHRAYTGTVECDARAPRAVEFYFGEVWFASVSRGASDDECDDLTFNLEEASRCMNVDGGIFCGDSGRR